MKRFNLSDFDEVYNILKDNFPEEERREYIEQKNLLKRKEYFLLGEKKAEEISGFIALWEFEKFIYIEHFAVKECYRNNGLGESLLGEIKNMYDKSLVLEVELPENEITERRIEFYRRNGFFYNDFEYVQLPYSKDKKPVPLRIMSFPSELDEKEFILVRDTIYRELFGVEN